MSAGIFGKHPTTGHICRFHTRYVHKLTYLCSTNPDILLLENHWTTGPQPNHWTKPLDHNHTTTLDQTTGPQPLENIIRSQLILAWTGRAPPNVTEKELYALPVRLGGLGTVNPASSLSQESTTSVHISSPISHLIETLHAARVHLGCS